MVPFPSPLLMGQASGGGAPQPPFGNVVFLSGFEGTDGATTFSNSEGVLTGLAITGHGSAQIDTAQFKFGSSSLLLNGTTDYVSLADNSNWTPSINGCCAEAWIRFAPAADLTTKTHTILSQYVASGSQRCWIFNYTGSLGSLIFAGTNSGFSIANQVVVPWTPTKGVWYHVAAERSGAASGTYRIYVDGVMLGKTTTGLSTGFANTTAPLSVGALGSPGDYFNGWIDEARWTNGAAPYDSDAGFTVPSAAFPRS